MKILFDDIPESGLNVKVDDASWFPEGDWVRVGPVRAELSLTRRNRQVFLDGRLLFVGRFECDCCLESYEEAQDLPFKVEFEYLSPDDPYWRREEEHQCPETEMDVVAIREPEIDVEALLEQQVILSIPAKRLCAESCQGLCPTCGHNLNKGPCDCHGPESVSPFQVLAQVKGR